MELQLHKEQRNTCNNRELTTGLPWYGNFPRLYRTRTLRDFPGTGLYPVVKDLPQENLKKEKCIHIFSSSDSQILHVYTLYMNIWIAGLYAWNYCCQEERKRFFLTLRANPVTALSLFRCLHILHIAKLHVVIVFPRDFYTGQLLQGSRHLSHLGSSASNIYSNTIRQYWLSECCWV